MELTNLTNFKNVEDCLNILDTIGICLMGHAGSSLVLFLIFVHLMLVQSVCRQSFSSYENKGLRPFVAPPHDAGHGSSGGGAGVEQLQVVMMRPLNIVNTCHTIVHKGAEFIR